MLSLQYLAALRKNLEDTSHRLRTALDPIQKEMRTFPVVPAPELCRDIASSLIERGFDDFPGRDRYIHGFVSRSGSTSWRTEVDFTIPSSRAADVFMAPIYYVLGPLAAERTDASGPILLPVKTSGKTMINGQSMRDHIAYLMRSSRREATTRSLTFRDIVRQADITTYNQLFGVESDVSERFINDITNISLKGNSETRDIIEEIRSLPNKYVRPTKLRLQTKTYIARADIRAYYVDKDPVRHLAASIVQSFLQGPKGYLQGFNAINAVLPPIAKNMVDWKVKLENQEVLHLVTGDLSSFTNSNVNTWVMALAIYHTLKLESLEKFEKPILANVSGNVLEFSISDVLRSFLFLTVGATARVGEETFVAPGGYLGVKANMRLTCLSFVACLRELEIKVRHMFDVTLLSQIGGDDFLLGLIGNPDRVARAMEFIRGYISCHVGSLKEFSLFTVSEQPDIDGHTDLIFCKKDLVTSRDLGPGFIRIFSRRKLPIMSQLIEHTGMSRNMRVTDFLSFRKGVTDVLRTLDECHQYVAAYDYAYRVFHQFDDTVVSSSFYYQLINPDTVEMGGNIVTRAIQRRVDDFPPIRISTGEDIVLTDRDRLTLISYDPNVTTTVIADTIMTDYSRRLVSYKRDGSTLRLESDRDILVYEKTELGIQLYQLFLEFRASIDFL